MSLILQDKKMEPLKTVLQMNFVSRHTIGLGKIASRESQGNLRS